jgi:hypothetical protein
MAQDARFTDIDLEREAARRDHLRSAVPTLVSVALLLGVTLVGALVLRQVVDFGLWLVSGS